jgi:hypothetical protein
MASKGTAFQNWFSIKWLQVHPADRQHYRQASRLKNNKIFPFAPDLEPAFGENPQNPGDFLDRRT